MSRIQELWSAIRSLSAFDAAYLSFKPGRPGDRLWVVCSHRDIPKNKFAQSHVFRHLEGHKLFVNCPDNNWYLGGIPEFCDSIEAIISLVQEARELLGHVEVCAVGHSMGAYLALVLGHSLEKARYFSSSPEFELGFEGSRSLKYGGAMRDSFSELIVRLAGHGFERNEPAEGITLYGAFDPIDAYCLRHPLISTGEIGCVNEVSHHHGITEYLNGRGVYVGILEAIAQNSPVSETTELFLACGTYGTNEAYNHFFQTYLAVEKSQRGAALKMSREFENWQNPGWQYYRSRVFLRHNEIEEAFAAAKVGFLGAPHVYEHAIQFGRCAMALDDKGALRELFEVESGQSYRHRNFEAFRLEAMEFLGELPRDDAQ